MSTKQLEATVPSEEAEPDSLESLAINHIEIYQYDCEFVKNQHLCNSTDSIVVLLKLSTNDQAVGGWSEIQVPCNYPYFDLIQFASVYRNLKGKTLREGLEFARSHVDSWGPVREKLAQDALQDMQFKYRDTIFHHNSEPFSEHYVLFDCSQAYFSF